MMSDTNITAAGVAPSRERLALPGERVDIDGVALSISDAPGAGLPVLGLHAAGHGSGDFAELRDRLAGEHRVLTLDWPGHGLSAPDRVAADAARYGELLAAVLAELRLGPVVLVGCSVGGAAALRVAAEHPERVAGLVLCNAGGLAVPNPMIGAFTGAMAAAYRRGAAGAHWFPGFFAAKYRLLLRGRSARAQRQRIVAAGREHAAVLAELWASFGRPVNDLRDSIESVRCPVWLAWARSDPFNSHRLIAPALRRFDAPLTLFDGAHVPFLEQPDAFERGLREFLRGL